MRRAKVIVRWLTLLVSLASVMSSSSLSLAQSIDRAIQAYNNDNYEQAAILFAEVTERSRVADDRVRAEYYTGHALYKAGYLFPAYAYYRGVFEQGPDNPYFLRATEGLLNLGVALEDDLAIPEVINRGYSRSFQNLPPERLNTINYLIGMLAERRKNYAEARDFLQAINPDADEYPKALYLLGIMSLGAKQKDKKTFDLTLEYFREIEKRLKASTTETNKKLHRLALLGLARTYYSQGNYGKSIEYYEKIPRFSDDWYDAMFESGWAYRMNALEQNSADGFAREIGKALGMTHSVQSPYFDGEFRAESFVLKATAYFDMCHFDRARKTLEDFFAIYEPMTTILQLYVDGRKTDEDLVEVIVRGEPGFPEELRKRVMTNRRFQRFYGQVQRAHSEFEKVRVRFTTGGFKTQLITLLRDQERSRVTLTGRLIRLQLKRLLAFLEDFISQARIIKFEIADAERKLLESGQDIRKGPRVRGPRPVIPNAKRQYWGFNGEYWLDELGYYQYSIKNECEIEGRNR